MQSFKNLKVWEKAHLLTLDAYQSSKSFPREEIYGLTSQMRRSAVSVPSNIAEGKGHRSDKEFSHFLYHARGSLLELEDSAFDRGRITILISGRWAAIVGHM